MEDTHNSTLSDQNEMLRDALERRIPRFFRAAAGSARGRTGREDTEKFAEDLMTLQECSQIVGERLEMQAISYALFYEGDSAFGYRFDPNSHPSRPELVGIMVNRRLPMREMLAAMNEFLNE